ncbi:hypothetical protein [Blastochloris tepida]|uniref:Uncharacterized protein n=1 Tax=Blastochloris tepida TaxID=2233851 RepID=A0A348G1B2_9HYPH|nr:hypothetical protein [Blastochloris tepida]BBF93345.1 hypothetical protein BLTE_20300 [Blastochloris tepida]
MTKHSIISQPLPTLNEWLDRQGDCQRSDGFEAFIDVARRTIDQPEASLTPDEASFLRLLKGFLVATVELSNIEIKHGRAAHEIALTLPRVMAVAAVYGVASTLTEDAPMRRVAKIITEEFRFAAKEAANQITESRAGVSTRGRPDHAV